MKDLTYEKYIANPEIQEQLEKQARRERAEVARGIVAWFLRELFRRAPARQLKHA